MPVLARLRTRQAPARLVSTTLSNSASLIRMSRPSCVMPALATSTCTGPAAASASVKAASTDAGSVTSQATTRSPSGASAPSVPEREVTVTS